MPIAVFYQDAFNNLLMSQRWSPTTNHVVSLLLKELPFGLLYQVPLVAAALALTRRGRTWLDWTAGVIVWSGWLVRHWLHFVRLWSERAFRPGRPAIEPLDLMTPVVAILISLAIVRRLGPTWGPRLGIGSVQPSGA